MNIITAFATGIPIKGAIKIPTIPTGDNLKSIVMKAIENHSYFFTFSDSDDYYYIKLYSSVYVLLKSDVHLFAPDFISSYECVKISNEDDSHSVLFATPSLMMSISKRNIEIFEDLDAQLKWVNVWQGKRVERCYLGDISLATQLLSNNRSLYNNLKKMVKEAMLDIKGK